MSAYTLAPAPRWDDPALLARWRTLLDRQQSPERLYQSPAYFAYALEHGLAGTALFTVTDRHSGELAGLVPVVERWLSLDFPTGRQRGFHLTMPSVVILGSVPLLPPDATLWRQVCTCLLARYPHCQAISLPALPEGNAALANAPCLAYHLHGWRDCHTTPLRASHAAFLEQLGAKRRYNLRRQERQLEAASGGPLRLHRIVETGQVAQLGAALTRLATAAQRRQWLSDAALTALARHGLLHAYVLDGGGQPIALILALSDGRTLHIHNVLHAPALAQHSPGTAILFRAIDDARLQGLECLDFGYGTPAQHYQSINQVQRRTHLLLLRSNWQNRALRLAHLLWCEGLRHLRAAASRQR